MIKVTVVRSNPETNMRPVKVTYDVPLQDKMRVLDALNYIRENCDSSLAFRFSCRYYAKCGTCAVMVNGKPVLSCYEEARDGILVEPLANFPVIRDLVVDRSGWDLRVSHQLNRLTEAPSGVN